MSITIYINEKTSHYYDMKETVQISLRPRHRYKGTREGTGEEGQESDQHSLVLKLHTQWHHHALHMKIKCCESYWDRGTVHAQTLPPIVKWSMPSEGRIFTNDVL